MVCMHFVLVSRLFRSCFRWIDYQCVYCIFVLRLSSACLYISTVWQICFACGSGKQKSKMWTMVSLLSLLKSQSYVCLILSFKTEYVCLRISFVRKYLCFSTLLYQNNILNTLFKGWWMSIIHFHREMLNLW